MRSVSVFCLTALAFVILAVSQSAAQDRPDVRKLTMPELVREIRVRSEKFDNSLEKALLNIPLRGVDSLKIRNSFSNFDEALKNAEAAVEKGDLQAKDVKELLDAARAVFDWVDGRELESSVKTQQRKLSDLLREIAKRHNIKWEATPANKHSA